MMSVLSLHDCSIRHLASTNCGVLRSRASSSYRSRRIKMIDRHRLDCNRRQRSLSCFLSWMCACLQRATFAASSAPSYSVESCSKTLLWSPMAFLPSGELYFALLQLPPDQNESRKSSGGHGRPETSLWLAAFVTQSQPLLCLDSQSIAAKLAILIVIIVLHFRCSRSGTA